MTLNSWLVTFDLNLSDLTNVGQVLHRVSLQLPNASPEPDALPTATMNDGPPSSEFTITPALPCRERIIRLGGLALGEVTRFAVCANLACDLVCVGILTKNGVYTALLAKLIR